MTAFFIFIGIGLFPYHAQGISASSYCVLDSVSGRVLYEHNAHERRGMASTTKIMTALVALETANPADVATVSYRASRTEGSSLYLKQGEQMTIEDLVYGLMLNSGNDAAIVLAEHIGGSVEGFAQMMNDKAREIGAHDTAFKNPNGLDEEGHYTTAYDLALITRHALKNTAFATIAATKSRKITVVNDSRVIYLSNHNKLLSQLQDCDGVKTGYTKKTGRCLVSSVTRDGWQGICVTLNASDDWNDHTALLNRAFDDYKPRKILQARQFIRTAAVAGGEEGSVRLLAKDDFLIPAKPGEVFDFGLVYHTPDTISAPVGFEQAAGSVDIYYGSLCIGSVALMSENAVLRRENTGYMDYFKQIIKNWLMLAHN